MATENTSGLSASFDPNKYPVYDRNEKQQEEYNQVLKDQLSALENRYAQPNWFRVAAGFLKPQLGGFGASLGSASEALGENVEQQRAMALPIAQMRAQLAQSQAVMGQNVDVADQIKQWRDKPENANKMPPANLIAHWKSKASELPAVKSLVEQQELGTRQIAEAHSLLRDQFNAGSITKAQYASGLEQLKRQQPSFGDEPKARVAEPNLAQTAPPAQPAFSGSKISPTNIGTVESRNTPYAVGPEVPGQGTAKGEMQVMDATAAKPGFGIEPAKITGNKEQDEAERKRLGTELFDKLRDKYQNDTYAAAAYNWGVGNTDKWIKQGADPDKLPAQVRDYIAKSHLHAAKGVAEPMQPPSQTFESSGATGADTQELVKGQLSENDKMWQPKVDKIISNSFDVTEKRSRDFLRAGTLLSQPDVQQAMGQTFKTQGFETAFQTALKEGFSLALSSPGGAYSAGVSAPIDKVLEAYRVLPGTRAKLIELNRLAMDDAVSDLREGTKALGGGHASTTEFQGLMSRMAHTAEPYKLMNQYFAKRAADNTLNEQLHEHWLEYSSQPDFARKPYSVFFKSKQYKNAIKDYGKNYSKAQAIAD